MVEIFTGTDFRILQTVGLFRGGHRLGRVAIVAVLHAALIPF
jgi:hypothetical protein